MSKASELMEKVGITEGTMSLDDVRSKLKQSNVWKELLKVDSQESYDALLDKYSDWADEIDDHLNPDNIDISADKLHYYQKEFDLNGLLNA